MKYIWKTTVASSDVQTEITKWKFLNQSKENKLKWFAEMFTAVDKGLISSYTSLPQKMTLYTLVK